MPDAARPLPEWMKAVLRAAAETTVVAKPGADRLGMWRPTPFIKEEVPLLGLHVDPLVGRGDQQTYLQLTPHHAREWARAFQASLLDTLDLWIQTTQEEARRTGDPKQQKTATDALKAARDIVAKWKVPKK